MGQDLSIIGNHLTKYVEHVNMVFSKNTVQRFIFDPTADVSIWSGAWPTGGSCHPLQTNAEAWMFIDKAPSSAVYSNGGSALCNILNKNAQVVSGMHWKKIWSDQEIANEADIAQEDYFRQRYALLHALGHLRGLGVGELYSVGYLRDATGIAPDNTAFFGLNPNGEYWGERSLAHNDPMLTMRRDDKAQFSPFEATIINNFIQKKYSRCFEQGGSFCRPPNVASTSLSPLKFTVRTVSATGGEGVGGCTVKAFKKFWNNKQELYFQDVTTPDGSVSVEWGFNTGTSPHASASNAMLVKAECAGHKPAGKWITVFDIQADRTGAHVDGDFGGGELRISMTPLR
jgi:hypothetical protein